MATECESKLIEFTGPSSSKVTRLRVAVGNQVRRGQILLDYEYSTLRNEKITTVSDGKLKASEVFFIIDVCIKVGDLLDAGAHILKVRPGCRHETVMKDMCTDCGEDLRRIAKNGACNNETAAVPVVHNIPELMVSREQAQQLGEADVARLLRHRRLVLLVDLDQTLIHTTHFNVSSTLKDVHHFKLDKNSPWYHMKLRPGTVQFLDAVKKAFELHICTFGNRLYAHHVAKILDPTGSLFAYRILSRNEIMDPFLKTANMKALFPCGEEMVCIIDDREDVWNYAANLIHVRPYIYFKNTGDINAPFPKENASANNSQAGSAAPSDALENQSPDSASEEDADDYLLYLREILLKVHAEYYSRLDQMNRDGTSEKRLPDMKDVIPSIRKKVLEGCRLVFSGFFRNDAESEEMQRTEAIVNSFGAQIHAEIIPKKTHPQDFTTHIVAARLGTEKVRRGKELTDIKIVNGAWLKECFRRWEHVDECLYPVTKHNSESISSRHDSATFLAPHGFTKGISIQSSGGQKTGLDSDSIKNDAKETENDFLNAFSTDDLDLMDQEVDTALDEDGDEGPAFSVNDEIDKEMTSSRADAAENDLLHLGPAQQVTSPWAASSKRKLDIVKKDEDSSDEEVEKEAKHLRSEDLRWSSSSSEAEDLEPSSFSESTNDHLDQVARELERELEER